MPVEEFRGRVHDDVAAALERPLQERRRERVVDDDQRTAVLRQRHDRVEIDEFQQRVGWRFYPDHRHVIGQRLGSGRHVTQVDVGKSQPRAALADAGEQAARAAIQVVHRNDAGTGVEQLENCSRRRHARRERETVLAALEIGNAALIRHARRILRARVLVTLVHARAFLHVRRRRVDRRHDRSRRRVRRLSRVNRARCKFLVVSHVGSYICRRR